MLYSLVNFTGINPNMSDPKNQINLSMIGICYLVVCRYFFIYDNHTTDYLHQLNDKMKETESWHKLIKNLPEAIACFDSQYDSLYLNRAAKRIFKVKDESKMRDKTETTITTSMDMSK